jgi:serine/threonine protein kinase
LIDFGSAVCYDARYEPPYYDRFYGTLNFASSGELVSCFTERKSRSNPPPIEILQGYPYQAAPAEVWSLGVLLSILLTGVPPFESQRDAVYGRIRLKHTITRDALSLMQRCLHPSPHSRYTIEQVKRHRWFAREGASRLPFSLLGSNYRTEQAAELAAEAKSDVVNGARPMLYKGGSS